MIQSFEDWAIKEKALFLKYLEKFQGQMPVNKKYTFKKYLKRGH